MSPVVLTDGRRGGGNVGGGMSRSQIIRREKAWSSKNNNSILCGSDSKSGFCCGMQWCSNQMSSMNRPLDGATVNYISVFDFLALNSVSID